MATTFIYGVDIFMCLCVSMYMFHLSFNFKFIECSFLVPCDINCLNLLDSLLFVTFLKLPPPQGHTIQSILSCTLFAHLGKTFQVPKPPYYCIDNIKKLMVISRDVASRRINDWERGGRDIIFYQLELLDLMTMKKVKTTLDRCANGWFLKKSSFTPSHTGS